MSTGKKWLFSKIKDYYARKQAQRELELAEVEAKYSAMLLEDEKNIEDTDRRKWDTHSIISFWVFGLLIWYAAYIFYSTMSVVYLILGAFIISMILDSLITFFARKIWRGWAIALTYFIVIVVFALVLIFVVPFFFQQLADALNMWLVQVTRFQDLLQSKWLLAIIQEDLRLPTVLKEYLVNSLADWGAWFLNDLQNALQTNISQIISVGSSYVTQVGTFAVKLLTSVATTLSQAVMMFVLAVFFSIEKDKVVWFISSLAGSKKNHVYIKLQRMYTKLGQWIKGQLIVCTYVWVMVWIVFSLGSLIVEADIPNIRTLALIAWITNIIPCVWPFIGMSITFFVVLVSGGWKIALLALGLYALVNQSENNILTPLIMRKTLWVSALLIMISMLLAWSLFWFMGVVLAVPIAVIITLVLENEDKENKYKSNLPEWDVNTK